MTKHRPQLLVYLGNKCCHCHKDIAEMVKMYGNIHRIFHFHHLVPREKSREYSNLIERKLSSEQLDELDKCVLLCNFCHGILHAQKIDGEVIFSINVEGKTATQKISGGFIQNYANSELSFISNEKLYIHPYYIQKGETDIKTLVLGTELNESLMMDNLTNIRDFGAFRLYSYFDEKQLFFARTVNDKTIEIEYDISLQLPVVMNPIAQNDESKGWIRHGVFLHEDGSVYTKGTVCFEISIPTAGCET